MRELGKSIWVHEDEMQLIGMRMDLRMTIVRLEDGGLWVYSPTNFSPELQSKVDALGPVKHLLAPSNGHNMWLEQWQKAYPEAQVWVSAGIPKKLPKLQNYRILGDANDEQAPPPWSEDFDHAFMAGVPFFCENVFLHRASASLLVCDLVQNHRDVQQKGVGKFLSKAIFEPLGFKDICMAPPLKLGFVVKDKVKLQDFLRKIAGWEFERIIVAHGTIIEEKPRELFQGLAQRFLG